jgi:xanthine dehydrogenase accessory factor
LDIGAETPEEIALSIMSEIVLVRRGGSGRPMLEIKRIQHRPDQSEPSVSAAIAKNSETSHNSSE